MTSKERMLLAMGREKPDRLPVTIHQWQQYHLKNYMGGMTDIEANRAVGLDASINYFETIKDSSPLWKVSSYQTRQGEYTVTHYSVETPEGTLTTSEGANAMTTWVTEHLIKNMEDIRLLEKYRPIPVFDREGAFKTHEELKDDGILRTFLCGKQGGCWQDACELYGVENLIYATYDEPEWVHEFLTVLLREKLRYIDKNLKGLPFDLIETGGGAASNTVISPDIHREFCLPYDQRLHDALHGLGYKVVYHTCGGMTKILDSIVNNNCDVSETLSPAAVGGDILTDADGIAVRKTLHPHVGMIGGMDQINLLGKGTKGEIERETLRLFNVFGKEGGYILSASDHFFDAPRENLAYFAAAAKECRY
jgi:uroporphyrinogen-III decarboxylase